MQLCLTILLLVPAILAQTEGPTSTEQPSTTQLVIDGKIELDPGEKVPLLQPEETDSDSTEEAILSENFEDQTESDETTDEDTVEEVTTERDQVTTEEETTFSPVDDAKEDYKYAVVVDCGSTGTRAHIYKWPANVSRDDISEVVRPARHQETGEALSKKIRPGLSSVRNNPKGASDYMEPIMDFLNRSIPYKIQPETPVYFMATAGLRQLKKEVRKEILDDLHDDLIAKYNFKHLHTEVISGSREGVYQWISVNAYGDRLGDEFNQSVRNFYLQTPNSRRYGMLEIGGASAQVSFEVTPELETLAAAFLRFSPRAWSTYEASITKESLNPNETFKLFSTTFLGHGTTSARGLAVDLLVREAIKPTATSWLGFRAFQPMFIAPNTTFLVEDSCLPKGAEQVLEKPVRLLVSQSKTIGFTPVSPDVRFNVRLIGTGNYYRCRQLLDRLLTVYKAERLYCEPQDENCPAELVGTNFIPFYHLQFLGLSELFYTTDEMIELAGHYNAVPVMVKTANICATPYDQLMVKYPKANRVDHERVLLECFKATWMLSWLHNGLLMPLAGANLTTVSSLNGNPLDWSLGAIISRLAEEPSD